MPAGLYHRTKETLEKMSKSHLGKKGEKSNAWKGGIGKWRTERTKTLEEISGRAKPLVCEICGGGGKICFDHDHVTGKFRGWICHNCNTALGLARDRMEVLQKLIDYLNKPSYIQLSAEAMNQLQISNKRK